MTIRHLLTLLSLTSWNTTTPFTITCYTLNLGRKVNQKFLLGVNVSFKASNKSRCFDSRNSPEDLMRDDKPTVSITGIRSINRSLSFSSSIDYILSFLVSDIGSISLGLIGLCICMFNRLSSIDLDASLLESGTTNVMGIQSRTDILAVIASGSVLLNGVSKLDVTSALATSVTLEGKVLEIPLLVENNPWILTKKPSSSHSFQQVFWALDSFLTLVQTAVLLGHDGKQWYLLALSGIIPHPINNRTVSPLSSSTPILDKFLKSSKETYLPTLQSLPGKTEFTYLPQNAQEVLLLPVVLSEDVEHGQEKNTIVVALASDTAKSLTPRDIAWCQVIANRLVTVMRSAN